MNDLAPSSYDERVRLARLAAIDGYGWADLVVRYGLKEDVARLLVWSTAARKTAK
jgi:hypothetical protein